MLYHWFKKLNENDVFLILIDYSLIIISIMLSWFLEKKGKVTSYIITQTCMLRSCTCNSLKRWICLKILYLNCVFWFWLWGVPLHKAYITSLVNFWWESNPCHYPYTAECVILYTARPILIMFLPGFYFFMELSLMAKEKNC